MYLHFQFSDKGGLGGIFVVSNEINQILSNYNGYEQSAGGYLVCEDCGGYYQLQPSESPSDFDFCECGGQLFYYADRGEFSNFGQEDEAVSTSLESEEVNKLISNLKNKAEKRKKLFEELSKKVEIQEELLNEIQEGKWHLWEGIAQKNIQNDVQDQKRLIRDIIEQENTDLYDEEDLIDTIMTEEAKLMGHIKNKRQSIRSSRSWSGKNQLKGQDFIKKWDNDYVGVNLNIIRLISLFIISLIILGFIYLFFIWIWT